MFQAWYRVFDYNGRSSRWQYWSFHIGAAIVVGLFLVGYSILTPSEIERASGGDPNAYAGALLILAILFVPPALALRVRRLHDFGWSGWAILLTFVPVGNFILELMLLFRGPVAEAVDYSFAVSQPTHTPQPVHIYNTSHATAADSVSSQTINVSQIEKLAEMHDRGLLTADEFAAAKGRLLSQM